MVSCQDSSGLSVTTACQELSVRAVANLSHHLKVSPSESQSLSPADDWAVRGTGWPGPIVTTGTLFHFYISVVHHTLKGVSEVQIEVLILDI